ncbi:hypothetical protein BHUM_05261 [Candidatus Burkholderia humilis]|nr:hypothetical protein BHUM_05261 [Candidatus Burkholderia humilis]
MPPFIEIDWARQTEDWLIPYNATDWDDGPLQTMLRLGTGSLALDYVAASFVLEQIKDSLIVVYVFPDCVASVRYRWHPMLLESLEGLFQSTRFYASIIAESATYREPAGRSSHCDQLRKVYGSLSVDCALNVSL